MGRQVLRLSRLRVYNEGEHLTVEGEEVQHVFILLRGLVRLHSSNSRTFMAGVVSVLVNPFPCTCDVFISTLHAPYPSRVS